MIFETFLRKLIVTKALFCFALIYLCSCVVLAETKTIDQGNVTGLPLPRFVSVKSNKVNVRRGPNSTYQIDWVYIRAGVPLKVIAEYENWRKVEDFQGEGGWVHSRLLSGKRFVIILDEGVILKRKPNNRSPAVALLKKGVIGSLLLTVGDWSQISVNNHSGWVLNAAVWGTFD